MAEDLKVEFFIWHDFDEDLELFKEHSKNLLNSLVAIESKKIGYRKNMDMFHNAPDQLNVSGAKAMCTLFEARRDGVELVAFRRFLLDRVEICKQKNDPDAKKYKQLANRLSHKITEIARADLIAESLKSYDFFISGVMSSLMEIPEYNDKTFRLAKNIFAARALLDSDPLRVEVVKNIIECLTPLLKELNDLLQEKDPWEQNAQCMDQLVEIFEVMSVFVGIKKQKSATA